MDWVHFIRDAFDQFFHLAPTAMGLITELKLENYDTESRYVKRN